MQSKETNLKESNDPVLIEDLLTMLLASGWEAIINKSYFKTLVQGERILLITKGFEDSEYTLSLVDQVTGSKSLHLTGISKINPLPLMTVLDAYSIVDLKSLSQEEAEDLSGLEATLSSWSL